eukprot:TRINITY_DN863_c0_g1_i5.p1 TRINITY_DN863_c0_g1~~TRINITY_DN863_c0_g1_i5.p1  ORF type:complete len:584 (-),score=105.51 TRINITY_DN863_c0_g1_i5:167-1918(-)
MCIRDSPTHAPTPTASPTAEPTANPTETPTVGPTLTKAPTTDPTHAPTPTAEPTVSPTNMPSAAPSVAPTGTKAPTTEPTHAPTPTAAPSDSPSQSPSVAPSVGPTMTKSPTEAPTHAPTPTSSPTDAPSVSPTVVPTVGPTLTKAPTVVPSHAPTMTKSPTDGPTHAPTPTAAPTGSDAPSVSPSSTPTAYPSVAPTQSPSQAPSLSPTPEPSQSPSEAPSMAPSSSPSTAPTDAPSQAPSQAPSLAPTGAPTEAPSQAPTLDPTGAPTNSPTGAPSEQPTEEPTQAPTLPHNCTVMPQPEALYLKPDPLFTSSRIDRTLTHTKNVLIKKFQTPWAGFDLDPSTTTLFTAEESPIPACLTETCATTQISMKRKPAVIVVEAMIPLMLCVLVAYLSWYLGVAALLSRLALCILAFLTAVTIENMVAKKLPPHRSRLCMLEWLFVYNFVLLASMSVLHCVAHYLVNSGHAVQAAALDKTMRISVPIVHLLSYAFAGFLGFLNEPTAELLATLVVLVAFVIPSVTFWLSYRSPEEGSPEMETTSKREPDDPALGKNYHRIPESASLPEDEELDESDTHVVEPVHV